jgi:vancomycin resistance protein YoaR
MSGLVLASSPRENIIFPGVFIGGIDVGGLSREQAIKLLGDIVNKKLNNGQVVLKNRDRQWSLKYLKLGIGFDVPASVNKALEVGRQGTAINETIAMFQTRYQTLRLPLVLDVNEQSLQTAIAGISSEISRQAKNAVVNYNEGSVVLVPENTGQEVQLLAGISRIKEAISHLNEAPVEIPVRIIPPRLTRNDLKGIKDSLGIGLAAFPRSRGETPNNVRLTIERLDGQLVRPGETFSFNKTVGANITEQGYRFPIITEGRLELKSDTGASRVASALYQAVIYAGLEVRERHAHLSAPGYISPGQDAAVTDKLFDLKFFNNTQTPVYLKAEVLRNKIIVRVFGAKPSGQTVQVITQTTSDQEDSSAKNVKVLRVYYNNGVQNKKELLSQDRYK